MCRLLAVRSDEPFAPADFLTPFALISKNSIEYQGHGWGCAWKDSDQKWQIYKNISPVWEDNFSRFPRTTLLIAHARSAFEDRDIVIENNMPFTDGERIFIFNGELRGVKIKEQGRIGAEKIFNFIRRFDSGDTLGALKKAVGLIRNRTRSIRGMNILLARGRGIYLSTFFTSNNDYFTMRYKEGPQLVVCSEPFPAEEGWQNIDNETIREW
jgi:glutamine amidotransferase